jgi:hypothetical protein
MFEKGRSQPENKLFEDFAPNERIRLSAIASDFSNILLVFGKQEEAPEEEIVLEDDVPLVEVEFGSLTALSP